MTLSLNPAQFKFLESSFNTVGIEWASIDAMERVINLTAGERKRVLLQVGPHLESMMEIWNGFWTRVNQYRAEEGLAPIDIPTKPVSLAHFPPSLVDDC